jgi:hypothetical protein
MHFLDGRNEFARWSQAQHRINVHETGEWVAILSLLIEVAIATAVPQADVERGAVGQVAPRDERDFLRVSLKRTTNVETLVAWNDINPTRLLETSCL